MILLSECDNMYLINLENLVLPRDTGSLMGQVKNNGYAISIG
jgi:hypothetical protein